MRRGAYELGLPMTASSALIARGAAVPVQMSAVMHRTPATRRHPGTPPLGGPRAIRPVATIVLLGGDSPRRAEVRPVRLRRPGLAPRSRAPLRCFAPQWRSRARRRPDSPLKPRQPHRRQGRIAAPVDCLGRLGWHGVQGAGVGAADRKQNRSRSAHERYATTPGERCL